MDHSREALDRCGEELRTFVRNRYFYGKLLDVHHFEAEQSYFNQKRWLLNRVVSGYGVVCGLNVALSDDRKQLYVEPGIALDPAGRELVVPVRSKPLTLPEPPAAETKLPEAPKEAAEKGSGREHSAGREHGEGHCDDERVYYHVCIRWHECESDPELVRVGSPCEAETAPCAAGSIRERYELILREGKAPKVDWSCDTFDLFSSGRLNYDSLARYVTSSCPEVPRDACIPLANLGLKRDGGGCSTDVDITVRPIVYTNDLLFELLIGALLRDQRNNKPGKY